MDFVTEVAFRDLILTAFPEFAKKHEKVAGLEVMLQDYAKIGSFLTNSDLVEEGLRRLNSAMRTRLLQMLSSQSSKLTPLGQRFVGLARMATLTPKQTGKTATALTPQAHTSQKVLTAFMNVLADELGANERRLGFNRGTKGWQFPETALIKELGTDSQVSATTATALPPGAPTLTGFVDAKAFDEVLLKLGYHWFDPGAGQTHGGYSHRIQWYILTTAGLKLNATEVSLFRTLPNPLFKNPAYGPNKRPIGLWDFLFDCVRSTNAAGEPKSDTYRSPELLHGFIKRFDKRNDPAYSLLSGCVIAKEGGFPGNDWAALLESEAALAVRLEKVSSFDATGMIAWGAAAR